MRNRTIQIKMVKDPDGEPNSPRPVDPEHTIEAQAVAVMEQATVCVVVGYTVCKSVNFFFRMAEHYLAR